MWMTPKMGIRSPSEWEDPYWSSDVNRMTDLDDWILANVEDKNQIVAGEFSWDVGTDTLSWTELKIANPRQQGIITVNASSIVVNDGWFAYVVVPRPYQTTTVVMSAGAPPFTDQDVVPIAYRVGSNVWLKNNNMVGHGIPIAAENVEFDAVGTPTYRTLQDLQNIFAGPALIEGGEITDGGSGTINVAAGSAITKVSNDDIAQTKYFDFALESGLSLTDDDANHVFIYYNSGSPQVSIDTATSKFNMKDYAYIGTVYRVGTTVHISPAGSWITNFNTRIIGKCNELNAYAPEVAKGTLLVGSSGRYLTLSPGIYYIGLMRKLSTAYDTTGADDFTTWYNDGAWQSVAAQSQIDNTQYNDYGVGLATLDNNKYGVHWFYMDYNGGHKHVVYGTGNYTYSEALDAQPPSALPGIVADFTFLVGKIIVLKSASTLETFSPFLAQFIGSGAQRHNDTTNIDRGDPGASPPYYGHITEDEGGALAGTNGTPSASNKYVTDSDPRNTDARTPTAHQASHVTGADQIPVVTTSNKGLCPVLSNVDSEYLDGKGNWTAPSGAAIRAVITDQKSNGTDGGSSASATWTVRALNTIDYADSSITVTSNRIKLALAGKYIFRISCPGNAVDRHQVRLYNYTGTSVEHTGQSAMCGYVWEETQTQATLTCEVNQTGTNVEYEVQHWCARTVSGYGFGKASSTGTSETYTRVEIVRIGAAVSET